MIFFEIADVEQMLDNTQDPIGEFFSVVTADVVSFGSSNTYEAFLTNTPKLGDIEQYPMLLARSSAIGVHVNKVVYNGYRTEESVQQVHDQALKERARLQAQQEINEHEQTQLDLKLQRAIERSQREYEMEAKKNEFDREQKNIEERASLSLQQLQHVEQLAQKRADYELEEAHLQQLQHLGVDLTQFLTRAGKHVVQIEAPPTTTVHLHSDSTPPNK
eukprot:TRINITY_DN3110_c0_g1_i1.p1 TRINITY_DN3110_c0_g1~~TRINITY_DN3110_c0_g1_i1.p1  ORF type:complete len:218 (+),score=95.85 TRINITY_DN3110_c0_g1_i1:862-1515(+)